MLSHCRKDFLCDAHLSQNVDLKQTVQGIVGKLFQGAGLAFARVVHQHGRRAEGEGAGGELVDAGGVFEVEGEVFHPVDGVGDVVGVAAGADDAVGGVSACAGLELREGGYGCPADAGGGAGNYGHSAFDGGQRAGRGGENAGKFCHAYYFGCWSGGMRTE